MGWDFKTVSVRFVLGALSLGVSLPAHAGFKPCVMPRKDAKKPYYMVQDIRASAGDKLGDLLKPHKTQSPIWKKYDGDSFLFNYILNVDICLTDKNGRQRFTEQGEPILSETIQLGHTDSLSDDRFFVLAELAQASAPAAQSSSGKSLASSAPASSGSSTLTPAQQAEVARRIASAGSRSCEPTNYRCMQIQRTQIEADVLAGRPSVVKGRSTVFTVKENGAIDREVKNDGEYLGNESSGSHGSSGSSGSEAGAGTQAGSGSGMGSGSGTGSGTVATTQTGSGSDSGDNSDVGSDAEPSLSPGEAASHVNKKLQGKINDGRCSYSDKLGKKRYGCGLTNAAIQIGEHVNTVGSAGMAILTQKDGMTAVQSAQNSGTVSQNLIETGKLTQKTGKNQLTLGYANLIAAAAQGSRIKHHQNNKNRAATEDAAVRNALAEAGIHDPENVVKGNLANLRAEYQSCTSAAPTYSLERCQSSVARYKSEVANYEQYRQAYISKVQAEQGEMSNNATAGMIKSLAAGAMQYKMGREQIKLGKQIVESGKKLKPIEDNANKPGFKPGDPLPPGTGNSDSPVTGTGLPGEGSQEASTETGGGDEGEGINPLPDEQYFGDGNSGGGGPPLGPAGRFIGDAARPSGGGGGGSGGGAAGSYGGKPPEDQSPSQPTQLPIPGSGAISSMGSGAILGGSGNDKNKAVGNAPFDQGMFASLFNSILEKDKPSIDQEGYVADREARDLANEGGPSGVLGADSPSLFSRVNGRYVEISKKNRLNIK